MATKKHESNGNGLSALWKMVALGLIGAVVALIAVLYGDIRRSGTEVEARVRTVETRQAVSEATKVDIERRLGDLEEAVRVMNGKLDQLLSRREAPATK